MLHEAEGRNIAPVARAYADLAVLAIAQDDKPNAELFSVKAVDTGAGAKAEPEVRLNPWLWSVRARVLLQSGRAREARDLMQRAVDADRLYDDPSSAAISADEATLRAATAAASRS